MLFILKINAQRFLTIIIAFGLLLLSPGAQQFVIAQTQPDEYELALEKLDELMELLQELRDGIDRTQFDVEALSLELAFEEPGVIVDWVSQNIYFEQYLGLLRGAEGTLMSHAGNALDQAVLLAKLLKDAGYEARIARATITEEEAKTLIQQMAVTRNPKAPVGDMEKISSTWQKVEALASGLNVNEEIPNPFESEPLPIEETDIYNSAREDAEFILQTLQEAGIELGNPNAEMELIEEARDYFWVEYNLGGADDWQQAHPAFANTDLEPKVESQEVFTDTIPENLQHRLRFEVFIEQKIGDELKTHALIDPWERPVVNIIGTPLAYNNFPDGITDLKDMEDINLALTNTNFYIPIFNGQLASGGQFFDLSGNLVPPEAASSPYASVFQTVGGSFSDATGLLDDLGSEEKNETTSEFADLSAQWIEYTLVSPNGEEKTHRRNIVDRIGYANRSLGVNEFANESKEQVQKALTQSYTFMIAVGEYSENYILDRFLERIVNNRPFFELSLRRSYFPDEEIQLSESELSTIDFTWLGHLNIYSAFDTGTNTIGNINYRPEPSLLAYSQELAFWESTQSVIDIVQNTRRSFEFNDSTLTFVPEALVQSGTWETHTEGILFDTAEGNKFNTMIAFEKAAEASIPTVVLKPDEVSKVNDMDITHQAKHYLKRDLENGFIAIVPKENSFGERTGWWRVDPNTGQTLGMIDTGQGAEKIERLIVFMFSMLIANLTALVCMDTAFMNSPNTVSDRIDKIHTVCLATAVLGGVTGLAVGALTINLFFVAVAAIAGAVAAGAGTWD